MANKVGPLIKEARTGAGMTQEQLAKKVDGLTAADISKAERGEKELTQTQLRQIAKLTGVTQASLLNAAKNGAAKTTSSQKPSAAKTTANSKKPASSAAKKPAASAAKKPASTAKKEEELKLTAAEKKLLELYRAADKDTKEAAVKLLKGEKLEAAGLLSSLLGGNGLLDGVTDLLGLGKK